jgi:hypothetical protein
MNRTRKNNAKKVSRKVHELERKVSTMTMALNLIADMTAEWPTERVAVAAADGNLENVMTPDGEYISFDKSLPSWRRYGEPAWERDLNPRKKEVA